MENPNIIETILGLDRDLNYWFRTSKAPMFYKKAVVKRRRKRLRDNINDLKEATEISMLLVNDYVKHLSYAYPPFGKFSRCEKVVNGENGFCFVFTVNVPETTNDLATGVFGAANQDATEYNVIYSYMKNGVEKDYSVQKNQITTIVDRKSYDQLHQPLDTNGKDQICQDLVAKAIMEDICSFLMTALDRSDLNLK